MRRADRRCIYKGEKTMTQGSSRLHTEMRRGAKDRKE